MRGKWAEHNANYYAANRPKELARAKEYRDKNREEINARQREANKKDPSKRKEIKARYRAKRKAENDLPGKVILGRMPHVTREYGLTALDVKAIFDAQGNKCAVCLSPEPAGKRGWQVDHCHSTNRVRGILCMSCNMGLGLFKDNQAALLRAVSYLADGGGLVENALAATTNLTDLARSYRLLKAKIKDIEDRHKAELDPYKEALKDLKTLLLHTLNDAGIESFTTTEGTVHKVTRRTYPLEDAQAFLGYIIENRAWEMLDLKCNSTAATDFLEEHGELPPGVRQSVHIDSSVLAPRAKG